MLGEIETDLRQVLGIDVVGVFPRKAFFGFPVENWKEWTTPWGQNVLVPGGFNITRRRKGHYDLSRRRYFGPRQRPHCRKAVIFSTRLSGSLRLMTTI